MPRRNQLLSSLSDADLAFVQSEFRPVAFSAGQILERPNTQIEDVCFFASGIASVVAGAKDRVIETGLIGRDGMTGLAVVFGCSQSPHQTFMQVAGDGWSIGADHLREKMHQRSSLRDCFLRYAHAFGIQVAYSAVANGRARIDERLARWLLLAHDRIEGDNLFLTHEFLSVMLGVRRAGVTTELGTLEQAGLIETRRGTILVRDRKGLKALAAGLYGAAEAEQHRVTGWGGKE